MDYLRGKKLLVGITGGIAIYKAAGIIRRLTHDYQCDVQVVMTQHALEFMTPLTFETFTDKPVLTSMWASGEKVSTRHIDLVSSADALLIIPATANIVAKTTAGIGDDLLSTMIIACPPEKCIFALAMNTHMYKNPVFQRNKDELYHFGYHVIEPDSGPLASRKEGDGIGRLAGETFIFDYLRDYFQYKSRLKGKNVLISGGPTREYLDDVRFVSNPSSGKMGIALARAAAFAGADVTLVLGPTQIRDNGPFNTVRVQSADEMADELFKYFDKAHIVIMSAAVEDIRPVRSDGKIKKKAIPESLSLSPNRDILKEMGRKKGDRILVGFSVETMDVLEYSRKKITDKNLDYIVINNPLEEGAGFEKDSNKGIILDKFGNHTEFPLQSKDELAFRIIDLITG